MKIDNNKTKVVFRKFNNGEIIALFPTEPYYRKGLREHICWSYMHIGQHSPSDYYEVIRCTKLASEPEYSDLYRELTTSVGYNLNVIKKYTKE